MLRHGNFLRYLFTITCFTVCLSLSACGQSIGEKIQNAPVHTSSIKDYDNLFSAEEEQRFDSLVNAFRKQTTIQIALVTFDSTMIVGDSIMDVTTRLGNAWGVGEKGKDNGVVVGISRTLRTMSISNGYGIEKVLSDEETRQIIDTDFIPGYKEGDYFKGTWQGLLALMGVLEKRYK